MSSITHRQPKMTSMIFSKMVKNMNLSANTKWFVPPLHQVAKLIHVRDQGIAGVEGDLQEHLKEVAAILKRKVAYVSVSGIEV